MELYQWISLAVLQGLTEFLPVSSSAHLLLLAHFGAFENHELATDIAIHTGSLLALFIHFRHIGPQLLWAALPPWNRFDQAPQRLLVCLAVASVPLALAGALAAPYIEDQLRNTAVITITTLVFALALALALIMHRPRMSFERLGVFSALWIGIGQALALIPGTSRAGICLTVAMVLGFDLRSAAKISFLLAIPALAMASGWQLMQTWRDPSGLDLAPFLAVMTISALCSWASIAFFMALLAKVGLWPIIGYRLALGLVLLFSLVI